jgi:flagellar motor switch protein FliN/FliY
MTGERARAELDWTTSPQPLTSWWKHQFKMPDPVSILVGAEASCCEAVGRQILESAGIQGSSSEEIQSTFLEIVTQTLSEWVGRIAQITGRAMAYDGAYEPSNPDASATLFAIIPQFAERRGAPIFVALPSELVELPAPAQEKEVLLPTAAPPLDIPSDNVPAVRQSRTLDLLLEVELPVSVSFGRARLPLKDVLKLTSGTIVELNRSVNDPVEVIVNNCVIARGEVVVVDGYYGIRIHQIVSRQERLRSLN